MFPELYLLIAGAMASKNAGALGAILVPASAVLFFLLPVLPKFSNSNKDKKLEHVLPSRVTRLQRVIHRFNL